jgi:hypothetical protein
MPKSAPAPASTLRPPTTKSLKTAHTSAKEPLFALMDSPIQGKGAFALKPIRKGTRLIEYTGKYVDPEEASDRYEDDKMDRHHTFLFSLNDTTVIDGADGGNESRFINHSCEPNCRAYIQKGHIYIYAERKIWPGEELVYDYSYDRWPGMTKADVARYSCRCGSPFCRGTILVSEEVMEKEKALERKKAAAARKKAAASRKKAAASGSKKASSSRKGASATRGGKAGRAKGPAQKRR